MKKYLMVSCIIAGIIVLFYFLLGPPKLLAKTSEAVFCARCHVMESEYKAWMHGGAHSNKRCVECHLPNQNEAIFYIWKSIDGLKDVVVFYSGRVPERIEITAHAKEVLQANCIRCHAQTVWHINQQRRCWDCHIRITHRFNGIREVI